LSRVVNPVTIGFVMFLYGVAHGMRAVSEWSFLGDVVSSENLSISNFYFSSVFDLGSALGATFAGSATTVMSTPDILSVASIVVASSIFVIAFTKTPQKDS
jgi:predicted MFS family arabinose efflux permease